MKACVFIALAALPGIADIRAAQDSPGEVEILQSWHGTVPNDALRRYEPAAGFVLDAGSWAELWQAWRKGADLPAVDFRKDMVLVLTAGGPNSVGCVPVADGRGNVRADGMCTLIGGPGFGYLLLRISRDGVRSVNGKPLPGAELPPDSAAAPAPSPQEAPGCVPGAPGQGDDGTVSSSPANPPGDAPAPLVPESPDVPPLKEIRQIRPLPDIWKNANFGKPLALRSAEEAAGHFATGELAALTREVDFSRQLVLMFVWRGSGQDRLEAAVAESYPEQIFFSLRPGRTRDLRQHFRLYALRSNVRWSIRQGKDRRL